MDESISLGVTSRIMHDGSDLNGKYKNEKRTAARCAARRAEISKILIAYTINIISLRQVERTSIF